MVTPILRGCSGQAGLIVCRGFIMERPAVTKRRNKEIDNMVTAPQVTLFIAVKAGSGGASVKFGHPVNVTIKAELLKDEDNVLIGSSSDKEEADNELYAALAEQLIRLIWKGNPS